jgi:hypothetical protein
MVTMLIELLYLLLLTLYKLPSNDSRVWATIPSFHADKSRAMRGRTWIRASGMHHSAW